MDTSNTVQIMVSSPTFSKLAENWFKKTKNEIIKIFQFTEKILFFNTGVIVTLIILCLFTSPETHLTGVFRVFLFLNSVIGILAVIFSCIFFDRFVIKFNKLLEILAIDLENDAHILRLGDYEFLKSKAREAIEEWHKQYLKKCEIYGPLSKEAQEAGKMFSKNYNLLRKFGFVKTEIEIYMKKPRPAILA